MFEGASQKGLCILVAISIFKLLKYFGPNIIHMMNKGYEEHHYDDISSFRKRFEDEWEDIERHTKWYQDPCKLSKVTSKFRVVFDEIIP